MTNSAAWWRTAAIYQVYPRSFADGNGDGVGDVAGIRARLGHLKTLGIDAIWFSPWYSSPMADAGYDVADYRDIDPIFGTLAEVEALIGEAHDLGLRVIVDIVPNHCSDQHAWFRAAVEAGPGSPERARFHFRPGRGANGELPPNDWQSNFGGSGWTRVPDGEYYFHMFAPGQPDLNWGNPEVVEEFDGILRFWLDRGVDGFRIDVAHGLVKADGLPDIASLAPGAGKPYEDQPGVHAIYQRWRAIADEYTAADPKRERVFVGEIVGPDPEGFARYLRADELHSAFNFDFLFCPWDPARLRTVIDDTNSAHALVGAPPTWVLSNHDVTRVATRYGRLDYTGFGFDDRRHGVPSDLELGTRRARAAALLSMALPGGVYVYQGDELGLWEVEDLDDDLRQDPIWERSGHTERGRDGCRVPLPWSGDQPPFGFSSDSGDSESEPWLPQPAAWKDYTAEAQEGDPASMLSLYRSALAIRPGFGDTPMTWLDSAPEVLAFRRGDLISVSNLGSTPAELPTGTIVLASGPLEDGRVPSDTTVWLRA
ncbi:alpha-glucosidase [Hamadaea flava]|uniref:Glycoside hydrolase family 13 protein n=1 Tax=Hamadaea flava TaxID=1742688 RepID=A0ABV8LPE2_9ACTN|nr:glycoside hydrolase family 13 protein [Hamadaea flava]MCP2322509.1 alpha-glucosidase [Hamadaea flava]